MRLSEWDGAISDLAEASEREVDVRGYFQDNYGGIAEYEKESGVVLPDSLKGLLG